jgi:hypothetical protein
MTRPGRIVLLTGLFLATAIATAWGTGMVYYTRPGGATASTILAGAIAVAGMAALAGILVARWRIRATAGFAVLFAVLLVWWSTIEPSNDRNWKPEVAVLPYATIDGDLVTVHNIRNFDYRDETDFSVAYYDKAFDLRELSAVDLVASYWAGPDIAHIFVSFGFNDRDHLAVSIERRDEADEGYSTVRGLFRQYEEIYIAADERDVIRLRTNFRQDPPEDVYLYRVNGPVENGRRLFMAYINRMNSLHEAPEFYNTLTSNCTTNIWMHSHVNPEHPPFSWKVLLSGHVPEYLYELGRLDSTLPFAELKQRSRIGDAARAHGDDPDFSRRIREGRPGMPL